MSVLYPEKEPEKKEKSHPHSRKNLKLNTRRLRELTPDRMEDAVGGVTLQVGSNGGQAMSIGFACPAAPGRQPGQSEPIGGGS